MRYLKFKFDPTDYDWSCDKPMKRVRWNVALANRNDWLFRLQGEWICVEFWQGKPKNERIEVSKPISQIFKLAKVMTPWILPDGLGDWKV